LNTFGWTYFARSEHNGKTGYWVGITDLYSTVPSSNLAQQRYVALDSHGQCYDRTLEANIPQRQPSINGVFDGVACGPLGVLGSAIKIATLFEDQASRWTVETYTPFAQALAAARALPALEPVATPAQIEAVVQALVAAQNALVQEVDTSALVNLIAVANARLADPSGWVSSKLAALQTAVDDSEALLLTHPTQEQVTAQAVVLAQALAAVLPLGDKSVLIALISVAQSLNSEQFTPSTWAAVAAAVVSGGLVVADDEASVDDVEQATTALEEALNNLVLRAAKAGLKSALDVAASILANAALYVPSTLTALRAAYEAGLVVYNDPNATQTQVAAAQAAVIAGIAQARLRTVPAGAPLAAGLISPQAAANIAQAPQGITNKIKTAQTAASNTVLKTFTKTPKPKVKGQARVGKKVKAQAGTWAPAPSLSYQWYRGAKAIKNATNTTYRVRPADLGKRLSVKITATKTGYTQKTKQTTKTVRVTR
jgi:hypothetical protein